PAAIQVASRQGSEEIGTKLMNDIVAAVQDHFPTLNRFERALLAQVSPTSQSSTAFAPIDDALRSDADPLVRLVVMYVRAVQPDDEVFALAQESGEPVM